MVPAVLSLDRRGRPVRPAILQNDARASREVADLTQALAPHDPLRSTGSPVTQQSVAPTALRLARNEPEVGRRARRLGGSYEWLTCATGAAPPVTSNRAIESVLVTGGGKAFFPPQRVRGL